MIKTDDKNVVRVESTNVTFDNLKKNPFSVISEKKSDWAKIWFSG